MKKLTVLLAIGFALITACIIYLIKSGVSVRSSPLIRPSIASKELGNIAPALVLRLYTQFQNSDFIILGFPQDSKEAEKLLSELTQEFEKAFNRKVHTLPDAANLSREEISQCQKPCWLLLPPDQANQLGQNQFIDSHIDLLGQAYFNLTWIYFSRDTEVPEPCVEEKRLSFGCLAAVSVHEARRKIEKTDARYFFLRRYLDKDFFLFIENPILDSGKL